MGASRTGASTSARPLPPPYRLRSPRASPFLRARGSRSPRASSARGATIRSSSSPWSTRWDGRTKCTAVVFRHLRPPRGPRQAVICLGSPDKSSISACPRRRWLPPCLLMPGARRQRLRWRCGVTRRSSLARRRALGTTSCGSPSMRLPRRALVALLRPLTLRRRSSASRVATRRARRRGPRRSRCSQARGRASSASIRSRLCCRPAMCGRSTRPIRRSCLFSCVGMAWRPTRL